MGQAAKNLVDLYQTSCETFAGQPLFGTKKDGAWTWISYGELRVLIDRARGGLAALGVGPGHRVAIISDNRVEWAVAAYATYGLGAAFVPMYQAQRPDEWKFILADCNARVAIAATDAIYETLQGMRAELPELLRIIGLARPATDPDSWSALLEVGAQKPVPARMPDASEVAGFIYTSGTTGKPKGALLSHGNIASNLAAVHEIVPLATGDRTLSFLPWAHSFGQTCELHMLLSYGGSTAINDDLNHLLDNLAEVKPTVLVAVPRIFNRIYDVVNRQIAARPPFVRRIIDSGIHSAIRRNHGERLGLGDRLALAFDDKLLFAKVRERFGGRLRMVISGSATLSRDVADFIDALGIPVYEGYGLTETSPIVSTNWPGSRKIGSVGRVLPGVKVVIDRTVTGDEKEGEIVVYGPNVMLGYHHRPAETQAALTPDGGLRTGDLGYLDADGFLYISGRIKEQYKLENGKYVMPSPLEETLKMSPYIANAMIYGDARPHNVALVVPNEAAVRAWCDERGMRAADLTRDPQVRELIGNELARLAGDFKGYERPRDFALVTEDFSIDNGLLTPTLKLKRREVVARYAGLIDELYTKGRATPAAPAPERPAARS